MRSCTVFDTRTSPADAWAATRAPTWTASPASLSPWTSHSPVWTPARTCRPSRDRVDDGTGTTDRTRRTVEGREKPVSGRVDLATAEALQLAADGGMVGLEQLAPATVAELGCAHGRADEVGEEHRREDLVGLRPLAHAGQELTDLGEREIGQLGIHHVVGAGQLDVARLRDRAREVTRVLHMADLVSDGVQDQRGHPDRRHGVADVDVVRHAHEHLGRSR
jgi:hypothetical protein